MYNENGITVTEDEIKDLYMSENPKFTLKMFETITKDALPLRHYRQTIQKMNHRLRAEAKSKALRSFIPATFDAMMLDFGNRVQRKELDTEYF